MDLTSPSKSTFKPKIGVYTKTVVHSSVIQFILHARIRHQRLNDVIFVGETFIHAKQVGHEGHLQHVAFKDDFDARIRHAAVFNHQDDAEDEDFLIKLEKDTGPFEAPPFPPQSIVLTLDSNDVAFVFLRSDSTGKYCFVQQLLPMPTFDRILYQPGQHLAVDSRSRALAVAAQEREIIIYAAEQRSQIQHEIQSRVAEWCPVSAQRRLDVEGVIQQVDFLIPPQDDDDHIVLILIVLERGLLKAVRIDWYSSTGPAQAQVHAGQALEAATTVSSLLIPLQDAAFLLVVGSQPTLWRDILSGSMTGTPLPLAEGAGQYPGISSGLPAWNSWAKPRRSQAARTSRDVIYLVREDGLVLYLTVPRIPSSGVTQSIAGNLDCHVGTAFASLGDEGDPDVLCVAGETSSGKLVSIGSWPTARRMEEMSRMDTMSLQPIELISNWASVTDMITADAVHTSRGRVKEFDNMFVTSGRQPYGAVTELRRGIEGSALAFLEFEALQTVSDVWVLPDLTTGSLVIVLSSPLETMLLRLDADFDSPEDVSDSSAFDVERRTLVAFMTCTNVLVQVTSRSICASPALHANFEDSTKLETKDEEEILCACAVPDEAIVATAARHGNQYVAALHSIAAGDDSSIKLLHSTVVSGEPLSMAATTWRSEIVIVVSTADGELLCLQFDDQTVTMSSKTEHISTVTEQRSLCDHVAILKDEDMILAVCGLRDGTLVTYAIHPEGGKLLEHIRTTFLGSSTVRLGTLSSTASSILAMTGHSTCLVTLDRARRAVCIENIWITDKSQPEFAQGTVTACAQMPHASYLSSDAVAEKLLVISGKEFIVLELGSEVSTVPRQIATSGTPNRLVYAESLRHLVCSGLHYEVRATPPNAHASFENKRQVWPVLDFIPVKGDRPPFTHHMQPGEKVNAILPWSFRRDGEKTYSYVLVGGGYRKKNGLRGGKVTFLQPKVKSWEVIDVLETRQVKFDQEVTALALYDETSYIVCAANKVHIYRLDVEEMKWEQLCPTFTLASAGVYITAERVEGKQQRIIITTAADSIVVLRVTGGEARGTPSLRPVCSGPRADYLLSHLWLPSTDETVPALILTGSKYGQLIGMSVPDANETASPELSHQSARLQFEAHLAPSLTRLRVAPPTARKGPRPKGLVSDRILGTATDGAVMAIATLEESTWRKLFWLQRLIEWSEGLSPFSHASPAYTPGDDGMLGQDRAVPVGFSGQNAEIMLLTTNSRLDDMHINGDVLARVLQEGGMEEVRNLMHLLAEEDANVGGWMEEHLEEELCALEGVVEVVRALDAWL